MRIARIIASLLTLGPVAGFAGSVIGKAKAHRLSITNRLLIAQQGVTAVAPELADAMKIALFSTAIGILCFIFGVTMHFFIAKKTQVFPRYAWYLTLVSSIVFLLEFPVGTVLGGITITLLFTLQNFKKKQTRNANMETPTSARSLGSQAHETERVLRR